MLTSTLPHADARRLRVTGAGFIALDVMLAAGSRVAYSGIGGTTGNVLSILAFLGWNSVPLVRLGRDRVGAAIHREFSRLGADMSHVRLERSLISPLLYQFADVTAHTPRYSFACPVCGRARRFSEELVDRGGEEFARSAAASNVFFFDRVTAGTVRMASAARAGGALVFFEPSSLPADRELFHAALAAAHVVKYSAERIEQPFTNLLSFGFIEIQTMGSRGLRFRKHCLAPDWVQLPALASGGAVVDTSGAGDWCTAGFLHTLLASLRGDDVGALSYNEIYGALRLGQAMAALSVRHVGARGFMRALAADSAIEMAQNLVRGTAAPSVSGAAVAQVLPESVCCTSLASYVRQPRAPLSLTF